MFGLFDCLETPLSDDCLTIYLTILAFFRRHIVLSCLKFKAILRMSRSLVEFMYPVFVARLVELS